MSIHVILFITSLVELVDEVFYFFFSSCSQRRLSNDELISVYLCLWRSKIDVSLSLSLSHTQSHYCSSIFIHTGSVSFCKLDDSLPFIHKNYMQRNEHNNSERDRKNSKIFFLLSLPSI